MKEEEENINVDKYNKIFNDELNYDESECIRNLIIVRYTEVINNNRINYINTKKIRKNF